MVRVAGAYRMPFGKHKGEFISDIPDEYISWLYSLDDLREPLRSVVASEFDERFFGRQVSNGEFRMAPGIRKFAREIVRSGFRQCSKRYHPDIGGTSEEFRSLREAFEKLKEAL